MINIDKQLSLLKNKICWGILAGFPNGSYINLHIGERIKREKKIENKNLKYGLDEYVGEYHIGIYCDWRLQENSRPITGSCEPNNLEGSMVKGLQKLIGKKITSIELSDECGDLKVVFEEISLKVFCNYTGNADEEYCSQNEFNWFIRSRGENLIKVEQGCRIIAE